MVDNIGFVGKPRFQGCHRQRIIAIHPSTSPFTAGSLLVQDDIALNQDNYQTTQALAAHLQTSIHQLQQQQSLDSQYIWEDEQGQHPTGFISTKLARHHQHHFSLPMHDFSSHSLYQIAITF
ncbi:hypothetical protein M758_UG274500 [Ceratodon purpureus]|nr:hypothetical protein M758_UG274500 [Ceratodon purpureus]